LLPDAVKNIIRSYNKATLYQSQVKKGGSEVQRFRVKGSGFRVQRFRGSGFRGSGVQGSEVQGLRSKV